MIKNFTTIVYCCLSLFLGAEEKHPPPYKSTFTPEKFAQNYEKHADTDKMIKKMFKLSYKKIKINDKLYTLPYLLINDNLFFINKLGEEIKIGISLEKSKIITKKIICNRHNIKLEKEYVPQSHICSYPGPSTQIGLLKKWLKWQLGPNSKKKVSTIKCLENNIDIFYFCPECRKQASRIKGYRDTDGDLITDHVENLIQNNPKVKDFNNDSDGDGFTNLQEFVAGTDINDNNKFPSINKKYKSMKHSYCISKFIELGKKKDKGFEQDSDKDGFFDLDELEVWSGILNPKSHPPFAAFMTFKEIKKKRFNFLLYNVEKPDKTKEEFIITFKKMVDGKWKSFFAKIGDIIDINNAKYKIVEADYQFAEKFDRKVGCPINKNVSKVKLKSLKCNTYFYVNIHKYMYSNNLSFIFELNGQILRNKKNTEMEIGNDELGYEKYKFKSLWKRGKGVFLIGENGTEYLVPKVRSK